MNILTTSFPSVFETTFGNNENASKDLLNGLKVKKDNNWYIVGNLAKKGGINADRITNASPEEDVYDVLFKACMVNVVEKLKQPLCVTMGFPLSTYSVYKNAAEKFLSKRHFLVEYDTKTFNNDGGIKRLTFDIDTYEIIPEIVGCIIGLKKVLAEAEPQNFIAISLGFGTIEGGMASEDGLIHRTCFSSHGLQYAVDNLHRELLKKYYLEMKNVHQMDDMFMKGSIFMNRKRIDLKELREEILKQYYREVVSPQIRKYFTNQDFEETEKIYLMGGGAYYSELVQCFKEEYGDGIPVEIAPEPEKLASIGYLYNSLRISDKYPNKCVGVDIGNSTTISSIFQESLLG